MKVNRHDIGTFLLRIILGIIFIDEGYTKFTNLSMTMGFFGHLGLPAFLVYIVAFIELVGGIAMLLGIFTEYAGIGFVVVLLGVVLTVHSPHGGFLWGHQYEMTLLFASLALALIGPGKIAPKWARKG